MNSLKDRPVNRTKNPAQIDPNCRGTTWHEAWHGVARSPKTVARCGTAVARRGTGLASHCFKAIFYRGTRSYFQCSVKTVEYGLKALLYNAIVAKHLMVSQVCLSYRPEWATTGNSSSFPFFKIFKRPSSLGRLAAAFALMSGLVGTSAMAETWSSVASQTNWQARTTFVREFSAPVTSRAVALAGTAKLDQLLSLIALAEANNGYDSVQHGASVKPPALPTSMTIRQIYAWIDATPGQPHAIGRYQFIPSTLRDLVRQLGVPTSAKFDRRVQDRLALALVAQAGYSDFASSKIDASKFMDNLALIWAGLPQADGRSAYHGYAGNRSTITRTRYAQLFAGIFS